MNATTIAAVYTFAAHYHSGQGSRGYRLLCAAERAWKRHAGVGPRLADWEAAVNRYQKAMRATHSGDFADYAYGNHELGQKYAHLAAHYGNRV
jgi:hypothetical protein